MVVIIGKKIKEKSFINYVYLILSKDGKLKIQYLMKCGIQLITIYLKIEI